MGLSTPPVSQAASAHPQSAVHTELRSPWPTSQSCCSDCPDMVPPWEATHLLSTVSTQYLFPQSATTGVFLTLFQAHFGPLAAPGFREPHLQVDSAPQELKAFIMFFFFSVTFETSSCCSSTCVNLSVPPSKPRLE